MFNQKNGKGSFEEPVHWEDALQAWIDGKEVRCFFENKKRILTVGRCMASHPAGVIEFFKKHTWYID